MRTIFTVDWKNPGRRILLASKSPRRSELMNLMGFSFEITAPDIDNEGSFLDEKDIAGSMQRLARAKTESASIRNPDALVLGADTIVFHCGSILCKPRSENEARAMLKRLNGSRHEVYSAVALECKEEGFFESAIEKTWVYFRNIEESEIESYIRSGEYADKAGAYAIQGQAMIFVDKIDGCFYNVVGLPVVKTISLFKDYVTRKDQTNV
jgi:septum formation protein